MHGRQSRRLTRAPFPAFAGVWGGPFGAGIAIETGPVSAPSGASTSTSEQRALAKRIAAAYSAGNIALGDRLSKQLHQLQMQGQLQTSSTGPTWTLQTAPVPVAPAATSTADPGVAAVGEDPGSPPPVPTGLSTGVKVGIGLALLAGLAYAFTR